MDQLHLDLYTFHISLSKKFVSTNRSAINDRTRNKLAEVENATILNRSLEKRHHFNLSFFIYRIVLKVITSQNWQLVCDRPKTNRNVKSEMSFWNGSLDFEKLQIYAIFQKCLLTSTWLPNRCMLRVHFGSNTKSVFLNWATNFPFWAKVRVQQTYELNSSETG